MSRWSFLRAHDDRAAVRAQLDDVGERDAHEPIGAEGSPNDQRQRRGATVRPDDLLDVAEVDAVRDDTEALAMLEEVRVGPATRSMPGNVAVHVELTFPTFPALAIRTGAHPFCGKSPICRGPA